MNTLKSDITIIGGGISGLLLQERLNTLGYSTLLLEHDSLGSKQTINSQGIIHGGIKYALLGQITHAATTIAEQTKVWENYLKSNSSIKILSPYHDLWNNGNIKHKLKQLLMQKALSSHGQVLDKSDTHYPEFFTNQNFKGSLYRINEKVLDTQSLLQSISHNINHNPINNITVNKIIKTDTNSLNIALENNTNTIDYLNFKFNNNIYSVKSRKYIFTAGKNNNIILKLLPNLVIPQTRPLHMVLVKQPKDMKPHIVYGHYTGNGILPELTITTHKTKDNNYVWYMGGKIAEDGIYLNQQQQILQAKMLLKQVFPWLDTASWDYASFKIDRAEVLQVNNKRPDSSYFKHNNNIIIAWPTKLTLGHLLAHDITDHLQESGFQPEINQINITDYNLEIPQIAEPMWDKLFSPRHLEKDIHAV